jgi:hypothetical protein
MTNNLAAQQICTGLSGRNAMSVHVFAADETIAFPADLT